MSRHAEPVTRESWLKSAPAHLRNLINRLTLHAKVRWDAPDYVDEAEWGTDDEGKPKGDGRVVVPTLEEAEAMSSLLKDPWAVDPDDPKYHRHALLLDLDVPAWLIPSSTDEHGHLIVDLHIEPEKLWEFLDLAAEIGLVEPGYVSACKSRGMTSLRLPWIKKGEEPSTIAELERQERLAEELRKQPDPWAEVHSVNGEAF